MDDWDVELRKLRPFFLRNIYSLEPATHDQAVQAQAPTHVPKSPARVEEALVLERSRNYDLYTCFRLWKRRTSGVRGRHVYPNSRDIMRLRIRHQQAGWSLLHGLGLDHFVALQFSITRDGDPPLYEDLMKQLVFYLWTTYHIYGDHQTDD